MSTDVISMSFSEKKEEKKKPKSPATPPSDGCLMFQLVARANQKTLDVLLGRHRDGCIIDTTPTQSSPSTSLLRLIFLDSHTGTFFFQSFYFFFFDLSDKTFLTTRSMSFNWLVAFTVGLVFIFI